MKKITTTLVVASFILVGSMALASENPVFSGNNLTNNRFGYQDYRDADPIMFIERGVEFYVFLDGGFDFNTVPTQTQSTYYRSRRGNVSNAISNFSANNSQNINRGIKIEHDYMGRVRRIGNVFINYDAFGRVKRIGSVYMRYNSFALKQIGNLRIVYNRRGEVIDYIGYVNYYNTGYQNYPNHYGGNNNYQNHNDDEDYYYYKKDGSKEKMKPEDIVEIKKEEKEIKEKSK